MILDGEAPAGQVGRHGGPGSGAGRSEASLRVAVSRPRPSREEPFRRGASGPPGRVLPRPGRAVGCRRHPCRFPFSPSSAPQPAVPAPALGWPAPHPRQSLGVPGVPGVPGQAVPVLGYGGEVAMRPPTASAAACFTSPCTRP